MAQKTGLIAIVVIVIVALAAAAYIVTQPEAAPGEEEEEEEEEEEDEVEWQFAGYSTGSRYDADWNMLGYVTTQEIGSGFEIPVSYTERVAVPDSPRVMREYADAGYQIIWAHGAQFVTQSLEVAVEYPDVTFVIETDGPLPEGSPTNVWNMDRNFQTGFYVLGTLAALKTETNKVGYLGGMNLPFSYGELNAVKQAVDRFNPDCELLYAWVGDFNDVTATRLQAEAMIAQGVDVILSSVNLGTFGLFEAVRAAGEVGKDVWITSKYTDKSAMLPEYMMTSFIFDFTPVVRYSMEQAMADVEGGNTIIEFGEGKSCYILFPIAHVTQEIEDTVKSVHDDVEAGLYPEKDFSPPTW